MIHLVYLGPLEGIRQRDPLSLLLFTIVAEALGAMLIKIKDFGLTRGYEARKNEEAVTHLQFADDTILFSLVRKNVINSKKNFAVLSLILKIEDQYVKRVYSQGLVAQRRQTSLWPIASTTKLRGPIQYFIF